MKSKKKKIQLDVFHYHEALDRSYVLSDMFSNNILDHPVIKNHLELKKDAEIIAYKLIELYQKIGNITDSQK